MQSMELHRFLAKSTESFRLKPSSSVVIFQGSEYPLATLSRIVTIISDSVVCWSYDQDVSKLFLELSTLFLGGERIFWLGSLDYYSMPQRKKIIAFLSTYCGPNTVFLFSRESIAQMNDGVMVAVPDRAGLKLVSHLFALTGLSCTKDQIEFFKDSISTGGGLSVDEAYRLCYQAALAGAAVQDLKDMRMQVLPDSYLFTLSDAFYARNVGAFLKLWRNVSVMHQDFFWIAFWSEQFFRASCFIVCMNQKRMQEAKSISVRLPFSFTRRAWREYRADFFVRAHQQLTQLDYEMKNGASSGWIQDFLVRLMTKND